VRNELLEHQMSDQEAYYRGLTASYEEIRKMRHDIDNHLYTMQALIGDGKVSQASDYMKQIIKEDRSALAFPSCGNTVIASYLTRKSEEYIQKQIRFDTDIHLPAYLDISNADLICIYGNILDNAEEAARQTDDPHITLLTQYKEPYVTVSCTNTAPEKERRKNRRIPELDRGLGTKIIMNITEKYDGEYTVEEENGTYRIEIILKNISRE
jgi:sensor histidine kinase regulating citrate/malate metabolism